jgi:hypothetical protein
MAVPTWARPGLRQRAPLAVALGCGLVGGIVAGAGQLGVAYGLGILRWDAAFARGAWHWQLTWLALLASVAVIAGAATGRWGAARCRLPVDPPLRVSVTLTAALGAAVMIPLVLHPARAAQVAEPGSPALTAVIATSAGLVLGMVAAFAVLTEPTVAGNVVTTVTWLWLVALGSAVWTIGRGEAWGSARPGLLPASGAWIPLLLLGMPALAALVVAAVARFGGSGPVRVAISGVAGPALLAVAYVIGAPGGGAQTSSYQYALLGVAVAAAVSVLVAVARKPTPRRLVRRRPAEDRSRESAEPAPRDEPWSAAHRLPAWTDAPDDSPWPADDSPTDPLPAARRGARPDETTVPLPSARGSASPAARVEETTEPLPAARDEAGSDRTTEPQPAKAGPTADPAGPEPDAVPAKRSGRRGRRRGQDPAGQPVAARDSDYVDWVRALGGSGTTGESGKE